jgi:hypothetical protein
MHAVVLSYPGHFHQTQLSIKSLMKFYPETQQITFVLDDIQTEPWPSYVDDHVSAVSNLLTIPFEVLTTSQMPDIKKCFSGWWRQQLVKLTLDRLVPGDQWFVVDGDVIFQTRSDIQDTVPVSFRYQPDQNYSILSCNYVKTLLGISRGNLTCRGTAVGTNPIPFRWLTRDLLAGLRAHVESRFGQEFVAMHLAWFRNQTIVYDCNPPTKLAISEWELIECYRRFVLGIQLPFTEPGSGYPLYTEINDLKQKQDIFLHSYLDDAEIDLTWLQQHLEVEPDTWVRSAEWLRYYQ